MALFARKRDVRRDAAALAQDYPALLAEADRVAAIVAAVDDVGRVKAKPSGNIVTTKPLMLPIGLTGADRHAAIKSLFATMNGKPPIRFISGLIHAQAWNGEAHKTYQPKPIGVVS